MNNDLKYSCLSDEDLFQNLSLENKKEIFSVLYGRYHHKIIEHCKKILKKETEVDELTQEIELKLWENIDGFKGNASLKTWVYAITYNHCIDYLRKQRKNSFVNIGEFIEIQDIIEDEDDEIQKSEIIASILMRIEKLSQIDRAIIKLRFLEKRTMQEIQTLLNLNKSAAKMRLKRALDKLKV